MVVPLVLPLLRFLQKVCYNCRNDRKDMADEYIITSVDIDVETSGGEEAMEMVGAEHKESSVTTVEK